MTNNDDKSFEDFVFLEGLKNAVSFRGIANPKALIGKCIKEFPDIKKDMAHFTNLIENIVEQINSKSFDEQKEELIKLDSSFFEKKKEKIQPIKKGGIPDLENAENGVIVRFEPAPSGHLHIGHLYSIIANYEAKRKYGGKFILRISDTNPDNIDIKNYDKVIDDIKWITDNGVDEIIYQSDRLEIYYKYLRTLIETGHAYVCTLDSESFKSYNDNSQPCPERNIDLNKQIEMFSNFMKGKYNPGEASVKFKGDLKNKNPALRDITIARINRNKHARVENKYFVWPTMNLAVAIDDSLMNLSHVIRGKDHETNMIRQNMIQKALGLKVPDYFHTGRVKFIDVILSKSELTQKIEDGIYDSWEDPRVPSIVSFKRRGFKAKAFREMILAQGITKRDSKVTEKEYFKSLNFYNKQILEKEADRAFFVNNPKKIHIINLDKINKKKIEITKHPEDKKRGMREFKVSNEFYIDGADFKFINENDLIRLMHFGNFLVLKKKEDLLELEFKSKEYDKNIGIKRNIHFVPINSKKCQIIMQDNSKLNGLCENLKNLKIDKSLQFERFGFVRFDRHEKNLFVFYFTQR